MAIQSLYPAIVPSLNLDFARSKELDPRITFTRSSTATYYDGVTTAGVTQADLDPGDYQQAVFTKQASAYKVNDFAAVLNNGEVATDTSGTIPVVTRLNIGVGADLGSGRLSGRIKKIAYYPLRLTNDQLQNLTK